MYRPLAIKAEEERQQGEGRGKEISKQKIKRGRMKERAKKKEKDLRVNYLVFSFSLRTPERLSKGQKLSNAPLIGANTAFAYAVRQHREIDGNFSRRRLA